MLFWWFWLLFCLVFECSILYNAQNNCLVFINPTIRHLYFVVRFDILRKLVMGLLHRCVGFFFPGASEIVCKPKSKERPLIVPDGINSVWTILLPLPPLSSAKLIKRLTWWQSCVRANERAFPSGTELFGFFFMIFLSKISFGFFFLPFGTKLLWKPNYFWDRPRRLFPYIYGLLSRTYNMCTISCCNNVYTLFCMTKPLYIIIYS